MKPTKKPMTPMRDALAARNSLKRANELDSKDPKPKGMKKGGAAKLGYKCGGKAK